MKKYIVIAGVNGAGKSTLYQTLDYLKIYDRVNTDEIVREFGRWDNPADSIKAGKIAAKKIKNNIEKGISFNQETTLCGNSIISNILKAKEKGIMSGLSHRKLLKIVLHIVFHMAVTEYRIMMLIEDMFKALKI